MKTCIYCLAEKDQTLFNKEHVVPQAMGKFEHNLVLTCVCKQCNDFFSASLDGILARDSLEAILRFKFGIKSLSNLSELRGKRLTLRVPPGPSAWAGAQIELHEHGDEIIAKPAAQIGFWNKSTNQYEYILYDKLRDLSCLNRPELDTNNFKVLASTDPELEQLKDILTQAGWNPQIHGELGPPINDGHSVEVEINYLIDRRMQRAIAKIAYNYFAAVVQPAGLDNLLWSQQLSATRSFIRYDSDPEYNPVQITDEPILHMDKKNLRHTDSHLVVLDWLYFQNGRKDLRASVSLFNHLTYHVTLIANFPDRPLPEITIGHQFDFCSVPHKCIPLVTQQG